jgi:hypothetical protein
VEHLAGMLAGMPALQELDLPPLSSGPGPRTDISGGSQRGSSSVQADSGIMRRLQELRPDLRQLADGSLAFLPPAEMAAPRSPAPMEDGE